MTTTAVYYCNLCKPLCCISKVYVLKISFLFFNSNRWSFIIKYFVLLLIIKTVCVQIFKPSYYLSKYIPNYLFLKSDFSNLFIYSYIYSYEYKCINEIYDLFIHECIAIIKF